MGDNEDNGDITYFELLQATSDLFVCAMTLAALEAFAIICSF